MPCPTRAFTVLLIAPLVLLARDAVAQSPPTPAEQIALAIQAAPASMREGATVMGYNSGGQLVRLRAGSNDLICLADNAAQPVFHVACYHRSLEPFMARGRQIRARAGGATNEQVDSLRLADIRARRFRIPSGAVLYQIFAPRDSVDVTNATVRSPSHLRVVYLPYATAASTGLSTEPLRGTPWLMDAGKPWAHIMIGP
jgi:hypothetical protein